MPEDNQNIKKFLPWLILIIIIVVAAGLRFHFSNVPLDRDEGEYAYAGQLILQHIAPYDQVYNMKLPGIYLAYADIMAIFGQSCTGIHLGLLVANAVTIVLIFLLVKYLIGPFAGVFAAAAFAVMPLAPSVQGISANAEHFVILFALPGILLLLYAIDRNNPLLLLASSVLLGISFLMKQHAIAFIVFAGLYLLFSQLRRRPFELTTFLWRIVLFIIGVTLPFGLICIVLWHLGVFERFWFWTFSYAREYISIIPVSVGLKTLKMQALKIAGSAIVIWILAGIGLVTLFRVKEVGTQKIFIVGFLLFSFLSTCPGLYFREHYFILLLPAIALLSGLGLFGIRQVLRWRKATALKDLMAVLIGFAALFYTLYHQKYFLLAKDPVAISYMTYGLSPFPASLKIAEFIRNNSSSDDTIAVLGSEPQIFFYAHRRSATGYIYMYPLMEPHPYALQMQEEMIQQIEATKPKFLIFVKVPTSWLLRPTSEKLILEWYNQYRPQYYNLVGVVDIISRNQTIYRWNQDAVEYTPQSDRCLAIFERKNGI